MRETGVPMVEVGLELLAICALAPLWQGLCGLGGDFQTAHDAALRQFHLEAVFTRRASGLERIARGMAENFLRGGSAFERALGVRRAPWFGADSAERDPGATDSAAVLRNHHCNRHQSKLVG